MLRRGVVSIVAIGGLLAALALVQSSPDAWNALQPFFDSRSAFWSTVAIFVGGLALAGWHLLAVFRNASRERGIIRYVGRRMNEVMNSADTVYRPREADIVASGLLGDNEPDAAARLKTSTGRVLATLHHDARFFRFEPVQIAVRLEEGAVRRSSNQLLSVQTLAIRAGILGTFCGLILSLARVQQVFLVRGTQIANGGDAALAADLQTIKSQIGALMGEVVQGLALAFGTSIAGLLAAMIIVVLGSVARSSDDTLLGEIQSLGMSAQKFLRDRTLANEELVRTADDLRNVMKDNLAELVENRRNLHNHAETLAAVSGELGRGLAEPVRLFAEHSAEIKTMLQQSRESVAAFRGNEARMLSIEETANRRLEALTNQLDAAARASADTLRQALETNEKSVSSALTAASAAFARALSDMGDGLKSGLGDRLGTNVEKGLTDGLAAHFTDKGSIVRTLMDTIHADSQRQSRRAFAVYMTAIVALTASGIAFQYREGIEHFFVSDAAAAFAGGDRGE